MEQFKKFNILTGWIVFAIAACVYLLTMEPTASFWDCSERIVAAYKLEVPHPPGAPFFMLMGNFFTIFAGGNVMLVAAMVNTMSALAAAFTILFLFWSVTHLARRIVTGYSKEISTGQALAILGSGLVGALAYTFTDSFWFVAVEAEAYATSSLFTALVFWAILKWENIADQPHANRWLILIAYVMGLSIGVHLLNLLTIPAIVLVFYFRKYQPTRWGVVAALAIAVGILGSIMYIIIPGLVTAAAKFELLFINSFGLPYNTGVIIFVITVFSLLAYGLLYTTRKVKVLANTIILFLTVIVIGYSSYTILVIRAQSNPPMNQNNPSTVFALLSYLNREQYGDRPLVKGQYYNAPVVSSKDQHTWVRKDGKYVKSFRKTSYEFDERFQTVFPRMWSHRDDHIREYQKWGDVTGTPVRIPSHSGETEVRNVPTFSENLRFFFTYQIGFMYGRYFMWNFAGRQNDTQGHGDLLNGNWITGIKGVDAMRLGNQDKLSDSMLNQPARNTYYLLPLILGLAGLIYQFKRDQKNFWVVALLFVMTGIAIVVYLNQTPLQPRERDYSYVGSFYTFSIWIGLGVLALYEYLRKRIKAMPAAVVATAICLTVPTVFATENWDDHDRSGRYVARDFARNYLNTCEPNAIIFTNGDNDTFPLWYAQEVEGVRTDVRVVNLSLLGTDWYINQMKYKTYESEPLPISMESDKYVMGKRDVVYITDRVSRHVELKQLVDFIASDRSETRFRTQGGDLIDYMPTSNIRVTVDKEAVLSNGVVAPVDAHLIEDTLKWTINKDYLTKSDMIVLDIIANNNWERPIYFVSAGSDSDLGLTDYFQLEGFAYRLVPIKHQASDFLSIGRLNHDKLYDNYINNFNWGRMNQPDVFIDHNIQRTTLVLRLRNNFGRLAHELLDQGKRDSAVVVLDRIVDLMPQDKFPLDFFVINIIEAYYAANEIEKANALVEQYGDITVNEMEYIFSLKGRYANTTSQERQLNLQILQELVAVANNNEQEELSETLENSLDHYYTLFMQSQPAAPGRR